VSRSLGDDPPRASHGAGASDDLEELRDILLRQDEGYLTEAVQSVLDEAMARKIEESKDRMATILAPIMGQAIRRQISQAKDDMVDALYPVIGKSIQRAVAEAMRDLAQRVDEGMRTTFSLRRLSRRLRARLRGIPESELLLREALPFHVRELFLIHRESGLLLKHLSSEPEEADRDLVGSMLTAIRDFSQDSFGVDRDSELDEIQYGDLSILIEPGPWAYLAAVVDGIEPAGFRREYPHGMRTALSGVNRAYATALEQYQGDAADLAGVEDLLQPLLQYEPAGSEPTSARRAPWLALIAGSAVLLLCLSAACFGAWQLTWGRPTATATPSTTATVTPSSTPTPSATPTALPTATWTPEPTRTPTASPSSTPSSTPTSTATWTPTATPSPAPYIGVMIGFAHLRAQPSDDSPLTGTIVDQGRPVEVVAVYRTWYLIRWPPGEQEGISGWVPGRWVGIVSPLPERIITPVP
jgi:hypothetical protein